MFIKHKNKVRKSFMISLNGIELLEKLSKDSYPELSYSQIVDLCIYHLAKKVHQA